MQEGAFVNTRRDHPGRADHPVAGAAVGADHPRGVHQPARRPVDHRGARAGLMVGALNLISVAFAVLFVGLGVDFGIQFSVRYRAERHENDNLHEALLSTARYVGAPLTLAAAATAAGFLSFLPTDYKGVSELGQIAGLGMIVAFITSITVIPALLTVLNPPGEPEEMGYTVAGAGRSLHGAPPHRRSSSAPGSWSRPGCRCSISCSSISIRSTCAARRSSRSRPSSTCAAIRRSAPTRSTCSRRTREAAQAVAEKLSQAARGRARQDDRELHSGRSGAEARRDHAARARCSTRCCSPIPARRRRPTPTTSPRSRRAVDELAAGGRQAPDRARAPSRRKRLADDLAQARRRRRGDARARAGGDDLAAADRARRVARAICRRSR